MYNIYWKPYLFTRFKIRNRPTQLQCNLISTFFSLKKEAEFIQNEHPGLMLNIEEINATPSVSGIIQLEDEYGSSIDSYKIKIVPTIDYPNCFPHVFETAGRIPINIDWHVYPSDGHCCIVRFLKKF